jgi:predicted protein tyrosine phosphatase
MTTRREKPFGRSYWVIPGQFLAGYYPGAVETAETEQKLKAIAKYNIQVMIDLTEVGAVNLEGIPMVSYEEVIKKLELPLAHYRFPIQDMNIPGVEQMKTILDFIDHLFEQGMNVYVHCLGGIGRTGTVVGCWLKRHHQNIDALQVIAELRTGYDTLDWVDSPETENQKKMIREWHYGQ